MTKVQSCSKPPRVFGLRVRTNAGVSRAEVEVGWIRMSRFGVWVACLLAQILGVARCADATDLRVVDASGLVRAAKTLRGTARLVITLQVEPAQRAHMPIRGECVAVNIDGLAAERKTAVTVRNECIFDGVSEGSWQIRVPEKTTWRVQVYE